MLDQGARAASGTVAGLASCSVGTMADIPKMRERAGYFRDQARWLRESGSKFIGNDTGLRQRFFELAGECESIADKIERNIDAGVHKS